MEDIDKLIKDLGHKDYSVRQNAVESLGIYGDETVLDALIPLFKDKNRFVRQETARTLGKIGGAKAVEVLTTALKTEKDEFVIDFINKALAKLQEQ